ncbi:hypothetical protein J3F84DRAFT_388457 [Trichoderma pleuroticola]
MPPHKGNQQDQPSPLNNPGICTASVESQIYGYPTYLPHVPEKLDLKAEVGNIFRPHSDSFPAWVYGPHGTKYPERVFIHQEPGPRNPRWGDVICDGSILRRKTDEICSFRLRVPCLKALNIPPEMLKELRKAALKLTNDLLTDEDLLLHALLLW